MKHIKRLLATIGTFGGIAGIVFLTGTAANGYIHPMHYLVSLAVSSLITLICISYINHNTEGGEWIE